MRRKKERETETDVENVRKCEEDRERQTDRPTDRNRKRYKVIWLIKALI